MGQGASPPPAGRLDAKTQVWRWSDLAPWLENHLGEPREGKHAAFLAALNDILDLRRPAPDITTDAEVAEHLASLLPEQLTNSGRRGDVVEANRLNDRGLPSTGPASFVLSASLEGNPLRKRLATRRGDNGVVRADAAHVLVVDDQPIVREVLERYLRREGYVVTAVADGQAAIEAFEAGRPDLILLDLMLPRVDGLEVFRKIRDRRNGTAVIMLTAKGEETDRVVGLDLGADDYVAKPFSPREIVARVRAVLRRAAPAAADAEEGVLEVGELRIDPRSRVAAISGEPVSLTPREFDLLHLFAANPRSVFSRLVLLEEVWDIAYDGDPSTVTVHIRRLREKIEADPSDPRHLITVWGAGYRFEP